MTLISAGAGCGTGDGVGRDVHEEIVRAVKASVL
jgi:predicted small secreted protein